MNNSRQKSVVKVQHCMNMAIRCSYALENILNIDSSAL